MIMMMMMMMVDFSMARAKKKRSEDQRGKKREKGKPHQLFHHRSRPAKWEGGLIDRISVIIQEKLVHLRRAAQLQ